jgi:hypothetical protein
MCTPQLIEQAAQIKAGQAMNEGPVGPMASGGPIPSFMAGVSGASLPASAGVAGLFPSQQPIFYDHSGPPVVQQRDFPGRFPQPPSMEESNFEPMPDPSLYGRKDGIRPNHTIYTNNIQSQIPMIDYNYAPYTPMKERIGPTIGDILGIKPGQYEEVGGPGSFRNLNTPLR